MKSKPQALKVSVEPHKNEAEDHLAALASILEKASMNATQLFEHCLNLLVKQLKVDRALMMRLTDLGFETFWWADAPISSLGHPLPPPSASFCPRVLERPDRTLVIRDAAGDAKWQLDPGYAEKGIRAFMGTPLREGGRPIGVLSVQHGGPKDFSRSSIALLNAMGNLLSRSLEVEALKYELRLTRDSLDLTSAVVEDSALENASTGLPNTRYLEIWLKANLFMAKRRGEPMAMVMWHLPKARERQKLLMAISDALRGEDSLVDLGRDHFLLLLPHTPQGGVEILVERIREKMGPVAMGGTFWETELDDLKLHMAMQRCEFAVAESSKLPQCPLVWRFLRPEDVESTA